MAVVNSWTLQQFRNLKGTFKLAKCVNSETGEDFTCIACEHPTKTDSEGKPSLCFVSFAKKLGELTPREIKNRANTLQVIENEEGRYTLCSKGDGGWETIDF